jgi:hypothetical protein
MIVFPGQQVHRKMTINAARGCHPRIGDRFDLTLECIRRHYTGDTSPLSEVLARYAEFFALFDDFAGFTEFFLLQDFVDDCGRIRFLTPFQDFATSPFPQDVDTYVEYRNRSVERIDARNRRIEIWATEHCAAVGAADTPGSTLRLSP